MTVPTGVPVGWATTVVTLRSGSPAQETVSKLQVACSGEPLGHEVVPWSATVPRLRKMGVTVTRVLPLIVFIVAVIVVVPTNTPETSPVPLMLALVESREFQATEPVRSSE